MGWKREIEELHERSALAEAMGGAEKVARQHEFGKLTIRERIEAIVDPGSFHEIRTLAGIGQFDDDRLVSFTPANYLLGTAETDGRPVMVSGDDFTVRGGRADASIAGKRQQARPLWTPMRHA